MEPCDAKVAVPGLYHRQALTLPRTVSKIMRKPAARAAHADNAFFLLRLFAAACVLCSHQMLIAGVVQPIVAGAYTLGDFGVLIFFSISGYLVAASWRRDPCVTNFALRRLLRLWPGMAASVLIMALVVGPVVSALPMARYFNDPRLTSYLANLVFVFRDTLPLRFPGSAAPEIVNGALWTIPLELACYAMLAALGVLGVLRRRALASLMLLAAVSAYMVVERRGEWIVAALNIGSTAQYLIEFALFFFAGALLEAWDVPRDRRRTRDVAACAVLAAWIAYRAHYGVLALWLTLPVAVAWLGQRPLGSLRALGRFGDLSYGIYLYGFPVQQIWAAAHGRGAGWTAGLAPVVLTTVLIAMVSWRLVEQPALARKPGARGARVDGVGPSA